MYVLNSEKRDNKEKIGKPTKKSSHRYQGTTGRTKGNRGTKNVGFVLDWG